MYQPPHNNFKGSARRVEPQARRRSPFVGNHKYNPFDGPWRLVGRTDIVSASGMTIGTLNTNDYLHFKTGPLLIEAINAVRPDETFQNESMPKMPGEWIYRDVPVNERKPLPPQFELADADTGAVFFTSSIAYGDRNNAAAMEAFGRRMAQTVNLFRYALNRATPSAPKESVRSGKSRRQAPHTALTRS